MNISGKFIRGLMRRYCYCRLNKTYAPCSISYWVANLQPIRSRDWRSLIGWEQIWPRIAWINQELLQIDWVEYPFVWSIQKPPVKFSTLPCLPLDLAKYFSMVIYLEICYGTLFLNQERQNSKWCYSVWYLFAHLPHIGFEPLAQFVPRKK